MGLILPQKHELSLLSIPQSLAVLCLGVGSWGISPFHVNVSILVLVLFRSHVGSHVVEVSGVLLPLIYRRPNLMSDFLVLWHLQSVCSPLLRCSQPQVQEFCCRSSPLAWAPHHQLFSALGTVLVFCDGFCLLQWGVSLVKSEGSSYLWIQACPFRMQLGVMLCQ